jgi:hypothetical protein
VMPHERNDHSKRRLHPEKRSWNGVPFVWLIAALAAIVIVCGCTEQTVRGPDSSCLITEARGEVRVAVFDQQTKTMIDHGWVKADGFKGWTLSKYDWEKWTKGN